MISRAQDAQKAVMPMIVRRAPTGIFVSSTRIAGGCLRVMTRGDGHARPRESGHGLPAMSVKTALLTAGAATVVLLPAFVLWMGILALMISSR
jgi:hypothetical protein